MTHAVIAQTFPLFVVSDVCANVDIFVRAPGDRTPCGATFHAGGEG